MNLHGPTIRARRLALGMTLKDVTAATGIDDSNLSKIERGQLPGAAHRKAVALAKCLDLSLDKISPEFEEAMRQAAL
jgi:transcriptional regulator with XRE-family HTH domain